MERIRRFARREGHQTLAKEIDESGRLKSILEELRRVIVHRAVVAWDRSPETFGEEIVALNDVHEALKNARKVV